MLDTTRTQIAAQQLYDRNGFETCGSADIAGIPSLLYRLRRKPASLA